MYVNFGTFSNVKFNYLNQVRVTKSFNKKTPKNNGLPITYNICNFPTIQNYVPKFEKFRVSKCSLHNSCHGLISNYFFYFALPKLNKHPNHSRRLFKISRNIFDIITSSSV